MGSLVVKIDGSTKDRLKNARHYSDLDVLTTTPSYDVDVMTTRSSKVLEVPMMYDVEAVKASIRNILMWRVGENVIRPQFGHNIHRSMYEQLNEFNKEKVCEEIKRAIEDNEPRAKIDVVAVKPNQEEDAENSTLSIRVVYEVIGNKSEGTKIVEDVVVNGR